MNRREWLQILLTAAAGGFPFNSSANAAQAPEDLYKLKDLKSVGRVTFMHMTDCHAQLLPTWYREPDVNLGVGPYFGKPPHLVGSSLLEHYRLRPGSREAHALTHLDFEAAAQRFGRVGGFAELATLIKFVRAQRPGALLLDGGDTWQGSATALWTRGADMAEACRLLGVDVMTGHWEFTYGADRVNELIERLRPDVEFVAQNVATRDFGDPVFKPYVLREQNGVRFAVIGQAFPYTPIANPAYLVPNWTFGIQEEGLQAQVDAARGQGARVVVVLSHSGMDVDLKLASRLRGVDAILGGHTHDAVPRPVVVQAPAGECLVTNAGSNGKFLGVLDFLTNASGRIIGHEYRLLPVFSNLLAKDAEMARHIEGVRKPYLAQLNKVLAVADTLLYRRGNFGGPFDQMILDGLLATQDAEIALSPGFRWGTTVLPGEPITVDNLMSQTAITYPMTVVNQMTAAALKDALEDICDNLFNPDPYRQQGGDMVRVGGMTYRCNPAAAAGSRISDMRVGGVPVDAERTYKVASWGPVSQEARDIGGPAIWDVLAEYLSHIKTVRTGIPRSPQLEGVTGNPGLG